MAKLRRSVLAFASLLSLAALSLAESTGSLSTNSATATSTLPVLSGTNRPPQLSECAYLNGISLVEGAENLHERCNLTALPAAPAPAPARAEDHPSPAEVQAIAEAVLEVLPETQHNFALDRDGAKVLAANPGAKKVAAILDDDSDTFMRNECKDDKWVVIELSQMAKVSRLELAQYELYSSRVQEFEVRGRQSHPRTDNMDTAKGLNSTAWKLLGRFTAEKAKGTQTFAVENPLWARYLLIRFLSHYGTEQVCAINGIGVHGKSAAEELEDHLAGDETLDMVDSIGGDAWSPTVAAPESPLEPSAAAEDAVQPTTDGGGNGSGESVSDSSAPNATVEAANGAHGSGVVGSPEAKAPGDGAVPSGRIGQKELLSTGSGGSKKDEHGAGNSAQSSPEDGRPGRPLSNGGSIGRQGTAPASPPAAPVDNATAVAEPLAPNASATVVPVLQPDATVQAAAPAAPSAPLPAAVIPPVDALEQIPVPKAKAGSSLYDMLVQEIRAAKAQQRVMVKAMEGMQRNLTTLAATLTKVKAEYEVSDGELAARVDAQVAEALRKLEAEVAELQRSAKTAAKREHAALSLLGMLGGALVLSMKGLGMQWVKVRRAVLVLALANGAVGLILHLQGAMVHLNPHSLNLSVLLPRFK